MAKVHAMEGRSVDGWSIDDSKMEPPTTDGGPVKVAKASISSESHDQLVRDHAPVVIGMAVVGYSATVGFAVFVATKALASFYAPQGPPWLLDWAVTVAVLFAGLVSASPVVQTIRSLRQSD